MSVFSLNPLELPPENFFFPMLDEAIMEKRVQDAYKYIQYKYGYSLKKAQMEAVFKKFDIDYSLLPHYLADKFDDFDITDY